MSGVCVRDKRLHLSVCASDSYNCRGSKNDCIRIMESKGEADWIIEGIYRKEGGKRRDGWRERKRYCGLTHSKGQANASQRRR